MFTFEFYVQISMVKANLPGCWRWRRAKNATITKASAIRPTPKVIHTATIPLPVCSAGAISGVSAALVVSAVVDSSGVVDELPNWSDSVVEVPAISEDEEPLVEVVVEYTSVVSTAVELGNTEVELGNTVVELGDTVVDDSDLEMPHEFKKDEMSWQITASFHSFVSLIWYFILQSASGDDSSFLESEIHYNQLENE